MNLPTLFNFRRNSHSSVYASATSTAAISFVAFGLVTAALPQAAHADIVVDNPGNAITAWTAPGSTVGSKDLRFTAVFSEITAAPEPASFPLIGIGLAFSAGGLQIAARHSRRDKKLAATA